ncbi:hypothetical protein IG631_17209 [Alternaria alternata]|nr:hypothetical protein IG631_17209 [Alternaria alternata]
MTIFSPKIELYPVCNLDVKYSDRSAGSSVYEINLTLPLLSFCRCYSALPRPSRPRPRTMRSWVLAQAAVVPPRGQHGALRYICRTFPVVRYHLHTYRSSSKRLPEVNFSSRVFLGCRAMRCSCVSVPDQLLRAPPAKAPVFQGPRRPRAVLLAVDYDMRTYTR